MSCANHTQSRQVRHVAHTWSFRERPVCSLPPTAPMISESRRSLAVWMSSSPGLISNSPARHSSPTATRPPSIWEASSSVRTPAAASALAYALLPCQQPSHADQFCLHNTDTPSLVNRAAGMIVSVPVQGYLPDVAECCRSSEMQRLHVFRGPWWNQH